MRTYPNCFLDRRYTSDIITARIRRTLSGIEPIDTMSCRRQDPLSLTMISEQPSAITLRIGCEIPNYCHRYGKFKKTRLKFSNKYLSFFCREDMEAMANKDRTKLVVYERNREVTEDGHHMRYLLPCHETLEKFLHGLRSVKKHEIELST